MISFQASHWSILQTQFVNPTCGPNLWARLMDQICGHNLWIIPAWGLKNEEYFRNRLIDCPCVGGVQLMDHPPRGALRTRSCSGLDLCIVPAWSLKNKELFRIGLVDCPRVEP